MLTVIAMILCDTHLMDKHICTLLCIISNVALLSAPSGSLLAIIELPLCSTNLIVCTLMLIICNVLQNISFGVAFHSALCGSRY